jgi:Fe2+ or Zn2+ uptake regulation protein
MPYEPGGGPSTTGGRARHGHLRHARRVQANDAATQRDTDSTGADGSAMLRRAGLRVTPTRLAVLRAVRAAPHVHAEQVIEAVRQDIGSVSHQAVYNVLAALVETGLLRRIEPAGSAACYEARVGDNHHHVVCRRCGAIEDVDCAVGRRPCLQPSDTKGFDVDEAEITFWGLCPRCRSRRHPPRPEAT